MCFADPTSVIADDGPGCVVYVKNFACGVSKKVSGFSPSPLFLVDISTVTVQAYSESQTFRFDPRMNP